MNFLNLTWKDVLDNHCEVTKFQTIDGYLFIVAKTKYNYFNWRGHVYKLLREGENLKFINTGILIRDLS